MFYGTFSISRVVPDPFLDPFWTVHLPAFSPALEPYSSALACWSTTRTRAVRGSCTPHSQVLYVAGFSVRDKLASPAIASAYSWFSVDLLRISPSWEWLLNRLHVLRRIDRRHCRDRTSDSVDGA